MPTALRIRLRPVTSWRTGSSHGGRETADALLHSDSLYGAVASAFARLGGLDEWLAATAATSEPAVRLSSLFPFLDRWDFVPPPRTHWPPPHSARVRWESARLVPVSLISAVLRGETPNEDRWVVDGHSGCLVPVDRRGGASGPFRFIMRSQAAVDRVSGGMVEPHRVAALQFAPNAGLWCVALFRDDEAEARWKEPLQGAFRWLADSGIGGGRSHGFGRSESPEFQSGAWPELLLKPAGEAPPAGWWLLSLMSPSAEESVDWTSGAYQVAPRGGRVESADGWGAAKTEAMMVTEGSVLAGSEPPRGAAVDAAPEGFPHPVWRVGFAVAVPVPAPAGGRPA